MRFRAVMWSELLHAPASGGEDGAWRRRTDVLRFILRLALWPLILTGRLLRRLLAKPAVRSFLIWCTAGGALLGAEWLGARLLLGAHHSALLAFTAALANCLTLWLLLSLLRIGRARRRLRVERFESLLALSPPRFEEYVGELL